MTCTGGIRTDNAVTLMVLDNLESIIYVEVRVLAASGRSQQLEHWIIKSKKYATLHLLCHDF